MSKKPIISTSNYETFVLDYFDGVLTAEETAVLFDFLELHPALKADFELLESFQNTTLIAENVVFPSPERLKKNAIISINNMNEENYQKHFIAYWENDLNERKKTDVLQFLERNPQLRTEFSAFGKLKLVADQNIVFHEKSALKQRVFPWRYFYYTVASVAAVLLAFFLFIIGNQPDANSIDAFVQSTETPIRTTEPTEIAHSESMQESSRLDVSQQSEKTVAVVSPVNKIKQGASSRKNLELTASLPMRDAELIHSESQQLFAISRTLEANAIFVKILEENDLRLLVEGKILPEESPKRKFWNFLSWGVKRYNQISGEQIVVVRMEDLTTNEVIFFFPEP